MIAVYAEISFAYISGIGWGWAGVIWLYSLIFYFPLDIIKFAVRYGLSGDAWNLLFDRKVLQSTTSVFHDQLSNEMTVPNYYLLLFLNRQLLLLRKIMGRKTGQLSGYFLREVYKDCMTWSSRQVPVAPETLLG